MSVKINLGAWNSVFAVPSKIVDEGLKFSDGVKLKVLLYVLRNADRQLDTESISAATGVNVTDIPEALEYWINMGILAKNNDVLSPIESKSSDIISEPVQEPELEPVHSQGQQEREKLVEPEPQVLDFAQTRMLQ